MSASDPREQVGRLSAVLADAFAAPVPGRALREAIAAGAIGPDSPAEVRELVHQVTRLVERGDALLQARIDDILLLQQQADVARVLTAVQAQADPQHGLGGLSPAQLLEALPPADRALIATAQLEDARARASRAEERLRVAQISLSWRITQVLRRARARMRGR